VDFRLISATNEDLESRVADGSFREDLFYRINTIPIRIPPLRERGDDVALLARHFLGELRARHGRGPARLSDAALVRLSAHPWRGNVRELQHAIETLVVFSEGEEVGEEDLPRALRDRSGPVKTDSQPKSFARAVEDYERRLLSEAIAAAGGKKAEAARKLGLDVNQIKYLCRKYRL
jgi:DNA-binding NtrC family response regulator